MTGAKSKQKEIREGIAQWALGLRDDKLLDELPVGARAIYFRWADDLMKNLHSQGLAIVRYPLPGEDLTGCVMVKIQPLIGGSNDTCI